MPWWHRKHADNGQAGLTTSAARQQPQTQKEGRAEAAKLPSIASMAKAILVTRRRLRLSPNKRLYFLYEPGKQVSSAIKIKNTSRSPVAFKFQTNAPKSCFMRPPSCILAPGETILATVVKFVEIPEQNQEKKSNEKFRIVSLKVKKEAEYTPEMFDENKELVAVEQVLRVIFLDPQRQSPEIEKLKQRLAEADAALQARKKPPEDKVRKTLAAGGVLDEWKEQQREKRPARQQIEGVDSPEVVV